MPVSDFPTADVYPPLRDHGRQAHLRQRRGRFLRVSLVGVPGAAMLALQSDGASPPYRLSSQTTAIVNESRSEALRMP